MNARAPAISTAGGPAHSPQTASQLPLKPSTSSRPCSATGPSANRTGWEAAVPDQAKIRVGEHGYCDSGEAPTGHSVTGGRRTMVGNTERDSELRM
jgi:hypothetical protein